MIYWNILISLMINLHNRLNCEISWINQFLFFKLKSCSLTMNFNHECVLGSRRDCIISSANVRSHVLPVDFRDVERMSHFGMILPCSTIDDVAVLSCPNNSRHCIDTNDLGQNSKTLFDRYLKFSTYMEFQLPNIGVVDYHFQEQRSASFSDLPLMPLIFLLRRRIEWRFCIFIIIIFTWNLRG